MFVLSEMTDTVRIPPIQFNLKLHDAVVNELNRKLANKVLLNTGLCIALFDITKLNDSYILPGDGASHSMVHFRYVIFRPFIDEIIIGKIKSCGQEGVYVTLGFFDDILIPPDALQQSSRFNEVEQVWIWEYEQEGSKHDLFMDPGEEIRFRVRDEIFLETTPPGPTSVEHLEELEDKKVPYTIIGSISEPGLGLLSWWTS